MFEAAPDDASDSAPVEDQWETAFERDVVADVAADSMEPVDVTSYRLPEFPHPLHHPLQALVWLVRAAFGIVSVVLLLAVIAAIPGLNFLALGYMLEGQGRVARTGRLRDAFLLLDVAPRVGSIALGIWLWIIPLRLIGTTRRDAHWVAPGGPSEQFMEVFAPLAAFVVATHLCLALARGGSFWCFFRPIKNIRWLWRRWRQRDYVEVATAGVKDFFSRLRLKHHFWLGVRGFAGGLMWLFIPTAMFAAASPEGGLRTPIAFLGAFALVLVLSWVPFLQARFAMEGSFRCFREPGVIRRLFRRAPLAFTLAIAITYVLSLPLYLPKAFLLPQDAMWVLTLVFIVTIYPTRVATGWALHRAMTKTALPWFGFRWLARWLIVPLLGLYVLLLFFTPPIGEHGRGVLFEHHALLLPVPF